MRVMMNGGFPGAGSLKLLPRGGRQKVSKSHGPQKLVSPALLTSHKIVTCQKSTKIMMKIVFWVETAKN